MQIAVPTDLTREERETQNLLKPAEMPKKNKKDADTLYIVRVKPDAPFESETIFGQEITKYDVASDSFIAKNQGKIPEKTVKSFSWQPHQKKAFIDRAKEIQKTIYNRKTKNREIVSLYDHIDIFTEEEFHDATRPKVKKGEVLSP